MNVQGLGPLLAWHHVEDHLITFVQHFEAFANNSRVMDEDIRAAFLRNETEPFGIVPPFHFAACHIFLSRRFEPARQKKQKTPSR